MSNTRKKLQGGIRINPNTDALVNDGDINVDSSDDKLKVRLGGTDKAVATEDMVASINTITEWTSYTPTFTGFGSPSGIDFSWRRVGSEMEVRGIFTSGTGTGVTAYIDIPSGYSIDSTVLPSVGITNGLQVGHGATDAASTGGNDISVLYNGTTTGVAFSLHDNTGGQPTASQWGSWFATAGRFFSIQFKVPISGWTSASAFVMTPAQSTLTDWASYTPTFSAGFGTVTNIDVRWRRVGGDIEIRGEFTTGTVAASLAEMGLPNSYTVGSDVANPEIVGYFNRGSNWIDGTPNLVVTPLSSALKFSISATSSNYTGTMNGDSIGSGAKIGVYAKVPIAELDATAQFLAAIPLPKVAYCRMKNTDADVTVGSNTTVTLSSTDGDIEIVSLASNDFTLNEGKYEIDFVMGMWCNGTGEAVGNCNLYNVTDAQVEAEGTAACGDGNNYGTLAPSIGSATVNFTGSAKTFRIRAQNLRNSGSHTLSVGYGSTSLAADKGYVKIKKIG